MILDASALLALLQDEPGADVVHTHLAEAAITSVNLEEVVGILVRSGMDAATARRALSPLGIPVVAFTEAMAWLAGGLRDRLPGGLGIADRCCLAAAASLERPVITADTHWRDAAELFGLELILVR